MQQSTKKEMAIGLLIVAGLATLMVLGMIQAGKLVLSGVQYAEAKRATAECKEWEEMERVMPEWNEERQTGYYITKWQKEQCDAVEIELEAHVL